MIYFKIDWCKKIISSISLVMLSCSIYANNLNTDIQHLLNQWRIDNHVPGVVLMISTPKSQDIFASGTTTLNGTTLVNATSLFAVGSITKTFVSAMILKLESDGKLNINDPMLKYFPQFPKWKNITIKQLLNMTSGTSNYSQISAYENDRQANFKKVWTSEELISLAYTQEIRFPPGQSWNYSNTNFLLLGSIIEKVTHKPLAEILQTQLIQPLALSHTFYSDTPYPSSIINQMAHGYYNHHDMSTMNPSNIGAASGGMLMSTIDFASWINHLLVKKDVLSPKQLDEMLKGVNVPTNPIYPANTKFGLGILMSTDEKFGEIIWYTGVASGYSSTFLWIPKYQTLVVAQANLYRLDDENFNLLFPNQSLIQDVLENSLKN